MTALDTFSLGELKVPARILCVGVSGSGKSYMIDHLYEKRFKTRCAFVTLCTRKTFSEYKWAPECYNIDEFGEIFDDWKEFVGTVRDKDYELNHLVVFDDTISVHKRDLIQEVFALGRQYYITAISSVQSYTFLDKSCRRQCQFLMLFQNNSVDDLTQIFNEFCGNIDINLAQFMELVKQYTSNHGCIVINNAHNARGLTKRILKYRA